jgi:hypothetical protein
VKGVAPSFGDGGAQERSESQTHLRGSILTSMFDEDSLENLRRNLNWFVAGVPITDSALAHWQALADEYVRSYWSSSPRPFLLNLVPDLGELRAVADRCLPRAQRRGLCHTTARLSGFSPLPS